MLNTSDDNTIKWLFPRKVVFVHCTCNCTCNPCNLSSVSLYEKLNELEDKKRSILDEMEKENKSSPAEEKERLLKQASHMK